MISRIVPLILSISLSHIFTTQYWHIPDWIKPRYVLEYNRWVITIWNASSKRIDRQPNLVTERVFRILKTFVRKIRGFRYQRTSFPLPHHYAAQDRNKINFFYYFLLLRMWLNLNDSNIVSSSRWVGGQKLKTLAPKVK